MTDANLTPPRNQVAHRFSRWVALFTAVAVSLGVATADRPTQRTYSLRELIQEERRIIDLGRYSAVAPTPGLDAIVITPDARWFGVTAGQRISPHQESADRARLHSRFPLVYDVAGVPVHAAELFGVLLQVRQTSLSKVGG